VLLILHLNGCKIANPTVPARFSREELKQLLHGYGRHRVSSRRQPRTHANKEAAIARVAKHDLHSLPLYLC